MSDNISVRKFSLEWMKWGSAIVVLGKRESGKTFFMRELIVYFQADWNIIFAGSDGSYDAFAEVASPLFIFDAFTDISIVEEKLVWFMELMKNPKVPRPKKILIVIDDLGMEDAVMKMQTVLDLFSKGRHFNKIDGVKVGVTVVIAIQYAKMIGPKIRSNFDYLFCFQLSSYECAQAVQKGYTMIKPKAFNAIMESLHEAQEFASLVVNKKANAKKLKRDLAWHKAAAVEVSEFVGSESVNDLTDRLYDKERYSDPPPRPVLEKKTRSTKKTQAAAPVVMFENDS